MKKIITCQINLYYCDDDLVGDASYMENFLEELVSYIGMNKIPESLTKSKNPVVFDFVASKVGLTSSDDGCTGVITLYESHAAFHSWVKSGFTVVVVSSCKPFDVKGLSKWCKNNLQAMKSEYKSIEM